LKTYTFAVADQMDSLFTGRIFALGHSTLQNQTLVQTIGNATGSDDA
jgi:hypothetical protein